MTSPSAHAGPGAPPWVSEHRILVGLLVGLLTVALLVGAVAAGLAVAPQGPPAGGGGVAGASPSPSGRAPIDPATWLVADPAPAPPLRLTDQAGRPFDLADRSEPTFVFFGYTHCPDVCPATIGHVGQAMAAHGPGVGAVFVSVDPERDTTAWLSEFVRYMPSGFTALTGTAEAIRATADAWGVRYAKVDTGDSGAYAMSHTADVFVVDGDGLLRAVVPFGTDETDLEGVLRLVAGAPRPSASAPPATPAPTPTPEPTASTEPSGGAPSASPVTLPALGVEVVSTSIWSGPPGPVTLSLSLNGVRLDDPDLRPTVQLASIAGQPFGASVPAVVVRPPLEDRVFYVADLPIERPGAWRILVTAESGGRPLAGDAVITALDPGSTAAIGGPAPTAHTPTLADAGGVARAVTTDPAPDLRLSQRSTTDALAEGKPFMLVVDSVRFKVSPACGRAVVMARYLADRWPAVDFIHLEPYRYSVITDTAVLEGSLGSPKLTDVAAAWGVGGDPWGPLSMPWIFVVDGSGVVRAKFQGVVGSDEVDVVISRIEAGG